MATSNNISRGAVTLLVGTKKGAFYLRSDAQRRAWTIRGPQFLGHDVHHIVRDPRDRNVVLMGANAGHLGPTAYRSLDGGKTWKEASHPPQFPKAAEGVKGRVVDKVFWLTPGHPSQPKTWFAGVVPQALFRTDDAGDTWTSVTGFNDHPMNPKWTGGDAPPDGLTMHSILVDPRDRNHMYLGMSGGGVFETHDQGATWAPLNKGLEVDFLPGQELEYGQDPHCMQLHPLNPDILYQQNHCGIYRMDRSEGRWVRVGRNMPKAIGDIGFPITLHPRDTNTAWVFPMDGTDVWPRVSPGGKPAVYVTRDAGKSWQRQAKGLPTSQGWLTVFRQAMCADRHEKIGLYFGTTSGEVWASRNEGESWTCIAAHLPRIQSVEIG